MQSMFRVSVRSLAAVTLSLLWGCQGAPEAATNGAAAPEPVKSPKKEVQTAPLARTMWSTSRLFGAVGADTDRVDIRFDPDAIVEITAYRRNGAVDVEALRYRIEGGLVVMTSDLGAVYRCRFQMTESEMVLDTPKTRGILKRKPWEASRASASGSPSLRARSVSVTAGAGGALAGTSWDIDVIADSRGDRSGGMLEFGVDGWMTGRIEAVNGSETTLQRRYEVRGNELTLTDDLGRESIGTFILTSDRLTIDMQEARLMLSRRNR
jgi:hypothetical protein